MNTLEKAVKIESLLEKHKSAFEDLKEVIANFENVSDGNRSNFMSPALQREIIEYGTLLELALQKSIGNVIELIEFNTQLKKILNKATYD